MNVIYITLLFLIHPNHAAKNVNISIGIIQWYCYEPSVIVNRSTVSNFSIQYNPAIYDFNSSSGSVYISDVAVLAAINIINRNPDILPNINVNVKRFTDCGSYYKGIEDEPVLKSAGYAAAIMADDILTTKDVLGLIGCEYSTTAKIPAQIFSLNKLPYGSFCSTSPRLADKANFSFFWRPLPSAGGHISALFKFWNVRRYAIIYESDDDMASQYAKSIIYFMASSNIRLLASIGISSDISSEVVDYVYASIQQTNSRYIIISGQSNFQNQIYFDLAKKGLIGSQYVYVTYSASTAAIDETAHGDALFQKYPGLIKFFSPATNSSNPLYREFYNEALSIMGASKEEISFEWFVSKNLEPNFDAAMIMLLGFDKVMKSNPNYTPEMLASRTLNSYMNYTLFQNVSYNGLLVAPLILNSVGDLNLPYVVAYYSANQSLLKAFGQTDMFGTSFEYLPNLKPVFYGGSSSPPPDGPPIFSPTELILDIQTSSGVFLLSVLVIGILECTASIVFLYCFRHKATMKRTSIAFLTPTTIGSTIFCISIVFLYGEASVQKCILKVWFQILGYCLIIGSLIMKMNMSVQLLLSGRKINKGFTQLKQITLPIIGIALIEIVLLVGWTLSLSHVVTPVPQYSKFQFLNLCLDGGLSFPSAQNLVLLIFNYGLLLVSIGYALRTRDVESFTGETAFSAVIVSSFTVAGIVVVPVLIFTSGSERMILLQAGCIICLVSITVGSLFVPKAITIYLANKAKIDYLAGLSGGGGGGGGSSSKKPQSGVAALSADVLDSRQSSGEHQVDSSFGNQHIGRSVKQSASNARDTKVYRNLRWGNNERVAVKCKSLGILPVKFTLSFRLIKSSWLITEVLLMQSRNHVFFLFNGVRKSKAFSGKNARIERKEKKLRIHFLEIVKGNAVVDIEFETEEKIQKFKNIVDQTLEVLASQGKV